ncbi:MAG TPA: helix-turn-helix domain-containing protein, partial [Ramlibacter sp.]
LEHALAHVTTYEEVLDAREEVRERVLPDGSMHLVFEANESAARLRVAGPSLRPAMLVMRGHVRGLSVKLKPGAALALFGTSAHEIADRAVPWDELVGARQRGLPERLQEADTDARRVALLTRTLHAMLDELDGAALRKVVHAAAMLRGVAGVPIPKAADSVGLSERRLQQLFQAHVGLSPRAWRRLARIHDCVRLLRRGEPLPWASVAAECGFSDQSHLSHEFRAICGLTPAQFLQRRGASLVRHAHVDSDALPARQA